MAATPINTCFISTNNQPVSSTTQILSATVSNESVGISSTTSHESINASESVAQSPDLHHLSSLAKKVADAEILWILKCVHSHFSAHLNLGMNDFFRQMFGESQIGSYILNEQGKIQIYDNIWT